jgi:hypothetical protein
MTSIKNTARLLKVGQIEKNPILALGTSEKTVEKYGRIAKMPRDVQVPFASRVIRDGLNKTHVGQLVGLYLRADIDSALRASILNAPLTVLDACPSGSVARRKEKRGLAERIAGNAGMLIRLAEEIQELLTQADTHSLTATTVHLSEMRIALANLCIVLDGLADQVSPGKPQAGDV